jgi:hypothetical protein
MGHFIHPRPQTATENCTWHNGTVVPLKNKDGKPRYVWSPGTTSPGISAVDFSDPMNPFEFAYVDPPPLVHPTNPSAIVAGGDWSSDVRSQREAARAGGLSLDKQVLKERDLPGQAGIWGELAEHPCSQAGGNVVRELSPRTIRR